MDTERNQGRRSAAMNNDFLSSQRLQQLQYTPNREMADPAHHQMMPLHTQAERQTWNAQRHTNQNYNATFSSASYYEIPAHFYGQEQLHVNKVATMQPQRSHQVLQHPLDSEVVQAAYHQLMSAQTNTQLSHTDRHSSPPLLTLQHRMPINRGVKRPFGETGFTESSPQSQPPPQPEFFHHYPLAANYQALPTYRQPENSSNQTHGMTSTAQEQFHSQQRRPEMRLSYEKYAQQAQQAEQIRMIQHHQQTAPYAPQQTYASNPGGIPPQYNSSYGLADGAQYQVPLQHHQYATDQMSTQSAQYQGPLQQNAAISNNVASIQCQHALGMDPTPVLARLYLDQRPYLRDWVQQHHDEYGLFMRFVRICVHAFASAQAPNTSQIPLEVMTVMTVARFQGISLIPEQILNAQQDASIQYLTRQLIVYLQMRAHLPRDIPNQAVGVETLYLCEHRGFPFTLPHHLLQTQLPSQPQQDRHQQCSNNSQNDATVNQPYSNTTPVPQQASPCPSQPSGRFEQVQNFRPQVSDTSYTHPTSSKSRDNSARLQEQLPIAAPRTKYATPNAPQAPLERPNAPSPTGSSWDPVVERAVEEAYTNLHAQEMNILEQTITSLSPAEAQPTQSLLEVSPAPIRTLATTATPLESQTSTPTFPAPSLTSKTSPSEIPTPQIPEALTAAGWSPPSQISPSYNTTPEYTAQASLTGALAREDAKDDPVSEEMGMIEARADAQWIVTLFHIPVYDSSISRQRERDQLRHFIPLGAYDELSTNAPLPGRQERMFLEFRAREKERREGEKEDVKGSEAVEVEEEEEEEAGWVWDGDVVGDEVVEGLFARMVRESEASEASEEALWADLFNGVG